MAYNFKEVMSRPERIAPGHRMCAGCGATIALRHVMKAIKPEDQAVICNATSCMEVSTYTYPYSAWKDSYIHNAFENAASTAGGVEAAYNALKRRGKISENYKFIAVGGDGGTYDIGFQSLSGAMERNHDMVYVCYDNEAYMNTGIQRSSATPLFADTTTTPHGTVSDGKKQNRKDIVEVIAAHRVPFVAQTTLIGNLKDLYEKSEKALYTKGACFLNILAPCPRGWRYETENIMDICKAAADTCFWPMYTVENGEKWTLSYEPKKKLPIEDFLKLQGRFRHLLQPGKEEQVAQMQAEIDRRWATLLKKCSL
jgi:pyruvate ferredoxin oxidoreductase beta subunit